MDNVPADRAQAEYLARLRAILRRAPADVREDALREVQSHIEDEWRALGGDDPAMRQVLQRLGPPEAYGRDLAVQLMLLRGRRDVSPLRRAQAVLFWAGTSLLGPPLFLFAALLLAFALGMLLVAVERLRGIPLMLIDAAGYRVFGLYAERVRFPPLAWSPLLIALLGLLPTLVVLAAISRALALWVRTRLAERGLAAVAGTSTRVPSPGWQRRAVRAMVVFALLGLAGCLTFTLISELVPIGRPGTVSLPQDFFRTPLTVLAFAGALLFLAAPILGLLWAARRPRH